jgi:hypothetical protein
MSFRFTETLADFTQLSLREFQLQEAGGAIHKSGVRIQNSEFRILYPIKG